MGASQDGRAAQLESNVQRQNYGSVQDESLEEQVPAAADDAVREQDAVHEALVAQPVFELLPLQLSRCTRVRAGQDQSGLRWTCFLERLTMVSGNVFWNSLPIRRTTVSVTAR